MNEPELPPLPPKWSESDAAGRTDPKQGKELSRWADAAMYRSEPMPAEARSGPAVTLLNATPDPLGSLAALYSMYGGRVVRNLAEVTDDDRRATFTDVLKTELQGALEVVTFHFLIEGVTRSFTHQIVRGRHAFYAQESLRFAVPDEPWLETGRIAYPPSLAREPRMREVDRLHGVTEVPTPDDEEYAQLRGIWDNAVDSLNDSYQFLVENGVPAEDARGLLPHNITTRLHWVVSLRELLHVAGLRLCTQAQFEWRQVMGQLVKAVRNYGRHEDEVEKSRWAGLDVTGDGWQFELIADQLRPVCYAKGECGFMGQFDRGCTIRDRVEFRARNGGRDSSQWDKPFLADVVEYDEVSGLPIVRTVASPAIDPAEWAADPNAGRGLR